MSKIGSDAGNPVYLIALGFFAVYPMFTAVVWVVTTLIYYRRREHVPDPEFYLRFLKHPRVRFVRKTKNEGKAMALNDVIPLAKGEIILVIDADAVVRPDTLNYLVPHFVRFPRVAAVTGNPRVANTGTLLGKIQAVEFSSIISILRRAQSVWGRILTVSGVVSAFRKSALIDVGLFDPNMATEDIALSWKLQKRFYDIRYEPPRDRRHASAGNARRTLTAAAPAGLGDWEKS